MHLALRTGRTVAIAVVLFCAGLLVLAPTASATEPEIENAATDETPANERRSGYQNKTGFGSKAAINVQLDEDDKVTKPAFRLKMIDDALEPWFDFKRSLHDKYGVELGTDYTISTMFAEKAITHDDVASVGIYRLFAKVELLGRGTKDVGSLFVKGEHRHKIGGSTPAGFGADVGYAGVPGTLFGDNEFVLNELNWQQYIDNARTGIIVGRFDPNDYMDVNGYANPWTTFQNVAILFNASIALPDTSWGLGAGHWLNDSFYVLASLNDANGVLDHVEPFKHGPELFKQAGFGWTPSRAQRYSHNLQVTVWHVDERDHVLVPSGEGIALNGSWTFHDTWMAFARMGWSDSPASLYEDTYTVGFAHRFLNRTDVVALAVNWGDPPASELREQLTAEAFYRLQLAQRLQLTISGQWLKDPVANPESDSVYIAGFRLRFTL